MIRRQAIELDQVSGIVSVYIDDDEENSTIDVVGINSGFCYYSSYTVEDAEAWVSNQTNFKL